jgi:hypothetical protein
MNLVVLFMCTNKSDEHGFTSIIDSQHHPVFVPADVKNDPISLIGPLAAVWMQGGCDSVEGQDEFGGSAFDGLSGHSKNSGRGFVLSDGQAASLADFQKSFSSIVAHSGQNGGGTVWAGGLSHRAEENIHARFMAIHGLAVDQIDTEAGSGSTHHTVDVSGNDQNLAWPNLFEVAADVHFHANFRVVVQPGGKSGGEIGGHVLNDHQAGSF